MRMDLLLFLAFGILAFIFPTLFSPGADSVQVLITYLSVSRTDLRALHCWTPGWWSMFSSSCGYLGRAEKQARRSFHPEHVPTVRFSVAYSES
jgi:hypothetical protein